MEIVHFGCYICFMKFLKDETKEQSAYIESQLLSHNLSLNAKELGFNEQCFAYYTKNSEIKYFDNPWAYFTRNSEVKWFSPIFSSKDSRKKNCTAPLYQQVLEWIREEHQFFIDIETDCTSSPKYAFSIWKFTGNPKDLTEREWGWERIYPGQWFLYRTYNQAVAAAITEAFQLIKTAKHDEPRA